MVVLSRDARHVCSSVSPMTMLQNSWWCVLDVLESSIVVGIVNQYYIRKESSINTISGGRVSKSRMSQFEGSTSWLYQQGIVLDVYRIGYCDEIS